MLACSYQCLPLCHWLYYAIIVERKYWLAVRSYLCGKGTTNLLLIFWIWVFLWEISFFMQKIGTVFRCGFQIGRGKRKACIKYGLKKYQNILYSYSAVISQNGERKERSGRVCRGLPGDKDCLSRRKIACTCFLSLLIGYFSSFTLWCKNMNCFKGWGEKSSWMGKLVDLGTCWLWGQIFLWDDLTSRTKV